MVQKEFLQIRRNRLLLPLILVRPLVQVILLSLLSLLMMDLGLLAGRLIFGIPMLGPIWLVFGRNGQNGW